MKQINAINNLELEVIFAIDVPHYTKMLQDGHATECEIRGHIGYVLRRVSDEFYEFHNIAIQDAIEELFQSLKCGRMFSLRDEVYLELDRVYHQMAQTYGTEFFLVLMRDVAKELCLFLGPQFEQGCKNARALVASALKKYREFLNPREFVPEVGEALLVALVTINERSYYEAIA